MENKDILKFPIHGNAAEALLIMKRKPCVNA